MHTLSQKIRLTKFEVNSIHKTFYDLFQTGSIYLFGSRVDTTKKGGDIDLFIDLDYHLNIKDSLELKRKFKMKLYALMGEQKIDILVSTDKKRSIEQEILQTGVLL